MRSILALVLTACPAAAWEFSPLPICTLTHAWAGGSATVTYDASLPEYAITLTRPEGWSHAPDFRIAFLGDAPLTIGTDRQELSEDRQSLTVRDRGFGNVLTGLERNSTALATLGEQLLEVPLDGAAEAVAAFRECPAAITS